MHLLSAILCWLRHRVIKTSQQTDVAGTSSPTVKIVGVATNLESYSSPGRRSTAVVILVCCVFAAFGQQPVPTITGDIKVDTILSRMTLDDKIALLHGTGEDAATYQGQAGYLTGIPRLGIPPVRMADGPPGVLTRIPATAPTATMGLAATFSQEDALQNGRLVARQAKARGIDVVLQPFINIDRDFAFGRGYNTYGEDPLLTGTMGAEFIRGVQGENILAQAKHYVAYDTDGTDVIVDQQALHEIYIAPFSDAVAARVSSIMCSYNKINGSYACGNDSTLNKILKGELRFKGFVTSDWGATHGTNFIQHGLDMEMPGPLPVAWTDPSFFVRNPPREEISPSTKEGSALTDGGLPEEPRSILLPAPAKPQPTTDLKTMFNSNELSEDVLTHAAGRVLLQLNQFGLLDRDGARLPTGVEDSVWNARVIEKTGTDAAVLLKNYGDILPLKLSAIRSLALIGPGARQVIAVGRTGEKAVGLPARQVGPFDAIRRIVGIDYPVRLAVANDMDGSPVPSQFLAHFGEPGLERRVFREDAVHIDADVNFTQAAGTSLQPRQSIVWTGTLSIPKGGQFLLHLQLLGCYGKLKIDDQVVAKNWYNWVHGELVQGGHDSLVPTTDGLDNLRGEMYLEAGPHQLSIEVDPDSSNAPVQVRFSWVTPEDKVKNYEDAIEAAKQSSAAVVFAWSRGAPTFALPGNQDRLIAEIAEANPNTVVVLNVSQPIAMPWLNKVKAVLLMWWPGDEGGWATAKLLLGKANPAGRLPFTWPRRAEDMPAGDPAHPERTSLGVNGKTVFSEGIFVGYRWFDMRGIAPLFPFGYGLSYTTFQYSNLSLSRASDGGADAQFTILNAGKEPGDEVAQVYLDAPASEKTDAKFAIRTLAGFKRIHLDSGEAQTIKIHLSPRRFEFWSTANGKWESPRGKRKIEVGGASRDLPLNATLSLN